MKRYVARRIASVLLLAALTGGCDKKENPKPAPEVKKVNVVTTVAPITSMVENIGGDKIRLTGIIPEGINSHTFEPVPSDIKILVRR